MERNNTLIRVVVSAVAIPVILAAVYFGNYFFLLFVGLIGVIAYYEFHSFAKKKGAESNLFLGGLAVIGLLLNAYYGFSAALELLLIFVVLILISEVFRNKTNAILNVGVTLVGIFYIGLFSSSLIGIREFYPRVSELYLRGGYLVISLLAAIWICDSAAFFGGTALGRHKLMPRVSPNKSWEGALFGFVFALITMAAAKFILLDFLSWSDIIVFGLIVGIIGQIGDLVESLFKRDAGVKDSSNIIPGHGGIFDRFDSLLFISPVVYLYLTFISR